MNTQCYVRARKRNSPVPSRRRIGSIVYKIVEVYTHKILSRSSYSFAIYQKERLGKNVSRNHFSTTTGFDAHSNSKYKSERGLEGDLYRGFEKRKKILAIFPVSKTDQTECM